MRKVIGKTAKIPGHFDKVAPQVKEYIAQHLFGKRVDITNLETLKKLNHPKVRGAIVSIFVDAINNLTIVSEEAKMEEKKVRASEIKPFPWTKLAVAAKDLQGKRWTEEISRRTGTKWMFLRVDQKEFEKARYNKFVELTI